MSIYHKHHIIPKHAGGTDDPSNLIQLTIEEHAQAHKKLFDEHGRWQDRIAWLTLSGQIDGAEAARQKRIEVNKARKGKKMPAGMGEKIRQANLRNGNKPPISVNSGSFKKGHKNFILNKNWITDGNKNSAVDNINDIPLGWVQGMSKKSNPQAGWNKGLFWTDKTKHNISNSRKGKGLGINNAMFSIENRAKVSASKIGRKWFHNPITKQVICVLPENKPEKFISGKKVKI